MPCQATSPAAAAPAVSQAGTQAAAKTRVAATAGPQGLPMCSSRVLPL